MLLSRLRELRPGGAGLAMLAVLLFSLALCGSALWFRDRQQQALRQATQAWEIVEARHRSAMVEKDIFDHFLPRYNRLAEAGLLGSGDRLALLDRIGQIREAHGLYPVLVEIGPEFFVPAPPRTGGGAESPPLLKVCRVRFSFSLLHEGDLLCLHEEMQRVGGFFLPESWVIERPEQGRAEESLALRENLRAACRFFWLTTGNGEEES